MLLKQRCGLVPQQLDRTEQVDIRLCVRIHEKANQGLGIVAREVREDARCHEVFLVGGFVIAENPGESGMSRCRSGRSGPSQAPSDAASSLIIASATDGARVCPAAVIRIESSKRSRNRQNTLIVGTAASSESQSAGYQV